MDCILKHPTIIERVDNPINWVNPLEIFDNSVRVLLTSMERPELAGLASKQKILEHAQVLKVAIAAGAGITIIERAQKIREILCKDIYGFSVVLNDTDTKMAR
jgi:hypothetical protein